MGNITRALPAIHPTIAIDCGDAVNHQIEFATACAVGLGRPGCARRGARPRLDHNFRCHRRCAALSTAGGCGMTVLDSRLPEEGAEVLLTDRGVSMPRG